MYTSAGARGGHEPLVIGSLQPPTVDAENQTRVLHKKKTAGPLRLPLKRRYNLRAWSILRVGIKSYCEIPVTVLLIFVS